MTPIRNRQNRKSFKNVMARSAMQMPAPKRSPRLKGGGGDHFMSAPSRPGGAKPAQVSAFVAELLALAAKLEALGAPPLSASPSFDVSARRELASGAKSANGRLGTAALSYAVAADAFARGSGSVSLDKTGLRASGNVEAGARVSVDADARVESKPLVYLDGQPVTVHAQATGHVEAGAYAYAEGT